MREDIEKLKRKRMNLRTKIREYISCGKDVTKLYENYEDILDKLKYYGVNVRTNINTIYLKKLKHSNINYTEHVIKNDDFISNNNYILNLVWNEDESIKNYINKLKNYVIGIGLEKIEEDFNDDSIKTEYIIKYKYTGTEESFKLLKRSLNEIINVFCEDNHNIGIYGSKQIIA